MRTVFVAALVLFAASADFRQDGKTLGGGVTLKESTAIPTLVAKPKDFVGKTIRVDGVATAVCTAMGCWMAVASESDPKGPVVRLKVEDGAIVFPMSAKGKNVSAEGEFHVIGDKDQHATEAAGEHAKQDAKASATYQIKATGAVIH